MSIEPMDLVNKANSSNHYLQADRLDEAEELIREVLRLSPDYYGARGRLGRILLAKGEPQAALEEFLQEVDTLISLQGQAMTHFALGDQQTSDRLLAEVIQTHGDDLPYDVALIHAYRGDVDEAFRWLDTAYETSASGLPFLKVSLNFSSLHNDPRWAALLEKMGYPD